MKKMTLSSEGGGSQRLLNRGGTYYTLCLLGADTTYGRMSRQERLGSVLRGTDEYIPDPFLPKDRFAKSSY